MLNNSFRALPKLKIFTLILFIFCFSSTTTLAQNTSAEDLLKQHSKEFNPEIIKVANGVYVAVGYGVSNSAMIVGDNSLIIIDTKESVEAAKAVLQQFRKISDKPVKTIIYTHSHRDHISGAKVFAGNDNPEIYAPAEFINELVGGVGVGKILKKRTQRQFGFGLKPNDELINVGIGKNVWQGGLGKGYLPATVNISGERYSTTIDGIRFELVSAPGETEDQIYIWLPDKKILFPGDNFYRAFPNLYPIRGSSYRDLNKWANSLEKMRLEKADFLVPSHTRPISGAENIDQALHDYAAAIRYVHDETVAGMNLGKTPDQLANLISLPKSLSESPYLQEFYGSVNWAVRSVFSGYLGWFDGNPSNLNPLSELEEAKRIMKMAGGKEKALDQLEQAMQLEDYQWSMQLADYLLVMGYRTERVTDLKITALRTTAKQQINATARNYYLSVANELEQTLARSINLDTD